VVALALLPATVRANKSNLIFRLSPVEPCVALVTTARTYNIPIEGIDSPALTNSITRGDTITALVTLHEKRARHTQWLIHLTAVEPTAKEQAAKPTAPLVLYASFDAKLECTPSPAYVTVRTLGPFVDSAGKSRPPKPEDKQARFSLDKAFLGLGLHHTAAAFTALKKTEGRGSWEIRNTPFNENQLAKGRKLAADLQLTPDQKRAILGAVPALMSYFNIVQQTPGLSDIFFKIVDLPSAWSLLRHAGVKGVGIQFKREYVGPADPSVWQSTAEHALFYLPLLARINDQPALDLTLVVTSPDPPLLSCAGVVGLLAERPGDKATYLTLHVLSARFGTIPGSDK
jgi:hypothetical protein